ncbi:protein-glutamate O-methyltransferase CheR [Pseudomonas sp. CAU 1711]|uniref:CheR family methyltransferase n=1 Tax=Pseudomonas sp. CAU 1711 TaxID=3140356 RepID=UPI0032604699
MNGEQRFCDFLKARIGLDVGSVGAPVVARAVAQRLACGVAADHDGYWQLLQQSKQEQVALIDAVIVPETWFFRYPESFAALVRLARPRLERLAGARPLRILSLPCATGEEPYSIAMALLDAGVAAPLLHIDALDVSPRVIERAQRGLYGKNSFRGEDLAYRARHFAARDDGYLLHEAVRELVRFQCGNLLEPGLLAEEPAYDLLFCRNLLIYFDQATQERVLEVLKRLTRLDGVLFIGPAEASLFSRLGMQSLGIAQAFAFQHPQEQPAPAPRPAPPSVPPTPRREARRPPAPPRRSSPAPCAAPPASAAGDELSAIAGLADQGRLEEARQRCERLLRSGSPSAELFYWLGLISDSAGKASEAQDFYRKALYLEPQHREALGQLAALLAARGDLAGAKRLQQRANRGANGDG